MNNSINKTNNINFTAKLILNGTDINARKINNITRTFEQRTRKYTDDIFEVNQISSNDIEMFLYPKKRKNLEIAEIKNFQDLFKQTDKNVAKKLETFFHILKKENNMRPLLRQVAESIPDEKRMDFWKLILESQDTVRKNTLAKDPLLKNIEIN